MTDLFSCAEFWAITFFGAVLLLLPRMLYVLTRKKKALRILFMFMYLIIWLGIFGGVASLILNMEGSVFNISYLFNGEWAVLDGFVWFEENAWRMILMLVITLPFGTIVYGLSKKHNFLKTFIFGTLFVGLFALSQYILPIIASIVFLEIILMWVGVILGGIYAQYLSMVYERGKVIKSAPVDAGTETYIQENMETKQNQDVDVATEYVPEQTL